MQKSRVVALSMGHFINDMYVGFLAPLLPFLIDKLGLTLTMAAGLASLLSIFTSVAQPVFGHIADKIKHPYLAVAGPMLTAIFLSSIGRADSYASLVFIIIFAGIGTAAFHPQGAAYAGRVSGRQNGLGMSMFVTGGSAGYYVGPLLIMSIVTWLGLRYSFVAVLPGIAISFVLFLLLPHLPHTPRQHAQLNGQLAIPHQLRSLILLFFISAFRSFIISGFNTFIPIYLKHQNVPPMLFAAALSIFGIPGSVGSMLSGGLSDRFGRKKVIFGSMALSLPFFSIFLLSDSVFAIAALGFAGFAIFSSIPVVIITAQELFPGRVNTVSSLVMGLSWGIGGLLVTPLGALAEHIGIGQALFTLVGVGVIAAVLVLFLPETKKVHS